jgi:DNA-binding winged helix-turn-helix (wHTH) protein
MMYSIGQYLLDSEKEQIFVAATNEIISDHVHSAQLLAILAEAYPKAVSKKEITDRLWRDGVVSDWALSTKIYRLRQLLAANDPNTQYIKTIHTQGFKLDVEPKKITQPIVDELPQEVVQAPIETPTASNKNRFKFSKSLQVIATIFFIGLASFGYWKFRTAEPIYGEILPAKKMVLPLNQQWESTKPDSIKLTEEGILVAPIDSEPVYVSTKVSGPGFYQGTTFSVAVKLTNEFIKNQGVLRFYYQSTQGGWPGEWDCILDGRDDLKASDFTYNCKIDEDGSFIRVLEKEWVNFGVKLHQPQSTSSVTIKSASISIPATVSTDKGWRTTDNLPILYDRGVAFHPKSASATLSTRLMGPMNYKETKLVVTLEIEDSLKNSDVGIVISLIDKKGKWHECFVDTQIKSNVFTKVCDFKKIDLPFLLAANETVDISIAPFGKLIDGKIKILGITFQN